VVFVLIDAVGAVGVPVNAGLTVVAIVTPLTVEPLFNCAKFIFTPYDVSINSTIVNFPFLSIEKVEPSIISFTYNNFFPSLGYKVSLGYNVSDGTKLILPKKETLLVPSIISSYTVSLKSDDNDVIFTLIYFTYYDPV
jgi:hypothetical protein